MTISRPTRSRATWNFCPRIFLVTAISPSPPEKSFTRDPPPEAFDHVGQVKHSFGPYPPERLGYTPPGGSGTLTDWGAFPATDAEMPDYQSAQWAVAQLKEKWDQPFFLSVGFVRPHVPFLVPPVWFDLHPLGSGAAARGPGGSLG